MEAANSDRSGQYLMFTSEEPKMNHLALPSFVVAAVLGLLLSGCGTTESKNSAKPAGTDLHTDHDDADHDDADHDDADHDDADHDAADHDDADHDHADHGTKDQTDMEKMRAELAKLTPEDAASAEKQHMCPVTGKMLGTMGPPQKVAVNGRSVWICCSGCRDKLVADPDKYLAKLNSR